MSKVHAKGASTSDSGSISGTGRRWGLSKDQAKKRTREVGRAGDAGKSNQFHGLTGKPWGDCVTESKRGVRWGVA